MTTKLNKSGIQKQKHLEDISWKFLCEKGGFWYFEQGNEFCKMDAYGNVRFLTTAEKDGMKNEV